MTRSHSVKANTKEKGIKEQVKEMVNIKETKMHSSRMRTVRCSWRLPGGGVPAHGVST